MTYSFVSQLIEALPHFLRPKEEPMFRPLKKSTPIESEQEIRAFDILPSEKKFADEHKILLSQKISPKNKIYVSRILDCELISIPASYSPLGRMYSHRY